MVKVSIPCRRYYMDEMEPGQFQMFVENMQRFTSIKIQYYNALYDSKYNKDISEDRLKGRNLTSWCKETFHIKDYYIAAINQMASGHLSSQKELIKTYINQKNADIVEMEAKITDIEQELTKKQSVKQALIEYQQTGIYIKPYPKCSIRIVNGYLSGYKIPLQSVEDYERKVNKHIRRLKQRIKLIRQRIKRKTVDLKHLKNDCPKRILFGSMSSYKKKDDKDIEDWKTEFMMKRYRAILFPGRHTSRHGNFLVKYDTRVKELHVTMMNGSIVTFRDFSLPRYEEEFLANFMVSPKERKSIGYQFLLKQDKKGRFYLLPVVMLTLDDDTHINHGFSNGCISMDLNVDHVALTEIGENGELLHTDVIPFDFTELSTGQTRCAIGNLMTDVGKICRDKGKPLCMEDLDFKRKKAGVHYKNKRQNHTLSSFAYKKFRESALNQGRKFQFAVYMTNPAYTSFIGKVKYMKQFGISIHVSAAYVIGLRCMTEWNRRFSWYDDIPVRYREYIDETKDKRTQWQTLYKKLKKIRTHDFYTM